MRNTGLIFVCGVIFMLSGCDTRSIQHDSTATMATTDVHTETTAGLTLTKPSEENDATRGLIARPSGVIIGPAGEVLIDFSEFNFVNGQAPSTVHPSLWRHARLNAQAGLFKVTTGIYQLRGFDLANMTLIEGDKGWILIDPLTSEETSAAALAFARQHLGEKSVTAVIFTHSHVDHFGGVLGVVSADAVKTLGIPIVAPAGFLEEATSENVLVGPAMSRRSM